MFRRKDDQSLFDNTTDPNQPMESASVVSAPQASNYAPQAQATQQPQNSAPVPPASTMQQQAPQQQQPQQSAAPIQRPVPAQPAQATSFRPSPPSPIGSDLSRNRMPEAKSGLSGAMANPNASNNASSSSSPQSSAATQKPRRVLTVGHDILLKGEIATCDRLVIEGKVDASLNDVHTVEISETGSFKGSANIEDAEISGLFEGDLVVRNRLVIYATGKVRGKISYGEIEIERGGEISGEIKCGTQAQAAPARRNAKADDKVAA